MQECCCQWSAVARLCAAAQCVSLATALSSQTSRTRWWAEAGAHRCSSRARVSTSKSGAPPSTCASSPRAALFSLSNCHSRFESVGRILTFCHALALALGSALRERTRSPWARVPEPLVAHSFFSVGFQSSPPLFFSVGFRETLVLQARSSELFHFPTFLFFWLPDRLLGPQRSN